MLGFVPVIGDVLVTAWGSIILVIARQLGALIQVLLRMAYDLLLNGVVGAIPLFRDLFSFQFKCHDKNVSLLIRAVRRSDEDVCEILTHPLTVLDVVLVLLVISPIIMLVGYVSLWFWERELHFL